MIANRFWSCCSVLVLLLAAAPADEIRLKDGRVLYGKVTEEKATATLAIATRDGTVRVAADDVVERTDDATLRQRLRELAKSVGDSPFAHLQLALRAHECGLETEMWQHLDVAVADRDQQSPAMQNRLDDFLGQLEPELLPRKWRTAETALRVKQLLACHRRNDGPGRRAALVELLRRETNADRDLRQEARRNSEPARRLLAVEALAARGTAGNDSFTWRTTILDHSDDVRAGAAKVAVQHEGAAAAVQYLAPGLMHPSAEVRVRTAEAFGNLADAAAIKLLVIAGPNAGKALAAADPSVRAHVAFINQQAYVRDFDVEVAQASMIADPRIGVLQSGTVLDVTVHGVSEEIVRITRAYRTSIQRLAGSDPGADPRSWPTWLMQRDGAATPPITPTPSPQKK